MQITYTTDKIFTQEQVQELFLSVNWVSGEYPARLFKALKNSSTVITAWDGEKLVGLLRVIDDGELVAFMHYALVRPEYQGKGIAAHMMNMVIEKYKDFLYVYGVPEESKNAPFYEKFGFKVMNDGVPMLRCNFENKI